MQTIYAISDLHGYLPEIPECDLLLIAGDICPVWNHHIDTQTLWMRSDFQDWLATIPAKHVIGIAGNHDFVLEKYPDFGKSIKGWEYLCDERTEWEGLTIYGTPWVPTFGRWAYMMPDNLLNNKWENIPMDTDILLVHGPPYMTLDRVLGKGNFDPATGMFDKYAGSKTLLRHVEDRLHLKAIVCGHIHEAYGEMYMGHGKPRVYNVSHVDLAYNPDNKPREVKLA